MWIELVNNGTTKWNESGFRPLLCTYRLNWARRTSWGWWDDWDDTALQTQNSKFEAEAVWGRARYLSVTEAPHNTNFHTWMGKKQFCFFQTAETGNRTPDSGVKGSGANHYPRAPAHGTTRHWACVRWMSGHHRRRLYPPGAAHNVGQPVDAWNFTKICRVLYTFVFNK